ncbi:rab-3A-interacting protein [Trichonephila clavipes]|nr:rab-3A-interacting protein [Trichonephila clavipes]
MLQEEVQALKTIVQSTAMYSAVDNPSMQQKKTSLLQRECYEVDPIFNDEFVKWRQNPNLDKETPFMKRIYEEDIKACLYFRNTELNQVSMAMAVIDVLVTCRMVDMYMLGAMNTIRLVVLWLTTTFLILFAAIWGSHIPADMIKW